MWRRSKIKLTIIVAVIFFGSGAFFAPAQAAANYRIYYSANDGGPNWRILTDKKQLAIDIGPAGSLDSAQAFSESVLREESGAYTMWYGGYDGVNWRILRATSSDGITWQKQGLALSLGASGEFDAVHMAYPYVIKDDKIYKLWYTAYDGKTHWRIGYAESNDGVIFKNRKIVLDVGASGALDAEHVHTPVVIKQGGLYIMYYAGHGGNPSAWRILRATSTDGINWVKQGLALDLGNPTGQDSRNLLPGSVIYEDGIFNLWYWAHGDSWRILYAASKNGIDWEKKGLALEPGPVRSLDWRGMAAPSVVK